MGGILCCVGVVDFSWYRLIVEFIERHRPGSVSSRGGQEDAGGLQDRRGSSQSLQSRTGSSTQGRGSTQSLQARTRSTTGDVPGPPRAMGYRPPFPVIQQRPDYARRLGPHNPLGMPALPGGHLGVAAANRMPMRPPWPPYRQPFPQHPPVRDPYYMPPLPRSYAAPQQARPTTASHPRRESSSSSA